MLVQNLSNAFSSWCWNKQLKIHFTSSGQVVEWRMLQPMKSRPLPPGEKSYWEKDWNREDRRGGENRWTKGGEDENSVLPETLFPFLLFPIGQLGCTFRIQPKHTVIPHRAVLTFCLHLVLWDPQGMGHAAARCPGGLALLKHTRERGCHSNGRWGCWFHCSWDYRQETPSAHSLHMTGHLSHLRPSHCRGLHDLHYKTRALIRVIFR